MARRLLILAAVLATAGSAAGAASAQMPKGDIAGGQKLWPRCAICHAVGPAAANKIGPQLNGVVGRRAGTAPGFTYSAAMAGSKLVWTPATLDAYLASPAKLVPGNKMMFAGLAAPQDRADLIAYLAQYGPNGAIRK